MTGYVCTIAGGKGGVGKTTTSINLGTVFQSRGYDTVVVDADLSMANLGELLDLDPAVTIHDVLAEEAIVSEALTPAPGDTTLLVGDTSLEAYAEADAAKLRKVLQTLRETFDVVFVDTGAGFSHETAVPLGLADGVVLVATPDTVALTDAAKTAEFTRRVDGTVLGGLLQRATDVEEIRTSASRLGDSLLGVVPDDPAAAGAEPLVRSSPGSDVADAYLSITAELERVFFEGVSPANVDPVVEKSWFVTEAENEETAGGLLRRIFG